MSTALAFLTLPSPSDFSASSTAVSSSTALITISVPSGKRPGSADTDTIISPALTLSAEIAGIAVSISSAARKLAVKVASSVTSEGTKVASVLT